ncbi:thioredoxin TrxC [Sulfurovum sp.]|uniref:thioredoxin TrxC n=1 Tax=Sulfurovum sp. TaxID=1969726 RepID=UPI002867C416|nr:thioredoxin TrxC [Sulfurovum sp.]
MNVNVVCPHCLEVSRLEKKELYTKENCTECGESLLDGTPVEGNANILKNFTTNSELAVIVDFWAPWCGPCLQMAPHFEDAAIKMPLQAQFIKINNDDEQTLGSKLLIASIPAVLVFKDGQEIDRFVGARNSTQIQEWVKQYI